MQPEIFLRSSLQGPGLIIFPIVNIILLLPN